LSFSLNFNSERIKKNNLLENFSFFKTKKIEYIFNKLSREEDNFYVFDITFSEGEAIAKEVVRSTMLHINLSKDIPSFTLTKEGLLERFFALAGQKDIDIPNQSDFSSRFYLSGDKTKEIQNFFDNKLVRFFESNSYYHVESNGNGLLIFNKERVASIKEIKQLLDFGIRLETQILQK